MTRPDPDCEYCGGTGEVSAMAPVYAGEPHMADVGSSPCECTLDEEDEYYAEDYYDELLENNQN